MQIINYRRDLYKLLPNVGQSVCAEIGVAEGYFSADMLSWGIKKLYMVDMWECTPTQKGDASNDQGWHNVNFEAAKDRVKRYEDRYEILRGPSTRMAEMVANESLDLINVDACHEYPCVKDDIAAWWPKLKKGGIIAFHDYEAAQYGVKQAVIEFAHNMYPGLAQENYGILLLPEDKPEDAGAYIVKR